MYQMGFVCVLSTAGGAHLANSYGGCDDRGSPFRAEAVGILSVSLFIALLTKHKSKQTSRSYTYLKI